jgi:anti-sigma B factor antagonist
MCPERKGLMSDESAVDFLTLEVEQGDKVAVVKCHGKLVAGVNDALYARVRQLIPANKRIVLDLSELTYMDSMGLGTLVRLYVSAKSAGCELVLINLGQRIRELLSLTNLLALFATVGEHSHMMRF